jgi:phosphate transport system substrate-binding protein
LATATVPDDFRFSIVNPEGAEAYPIGGVTWLLIYEKQRDAAKGKKLVEFLKWMVKEGEKTAADLKYAPLPDPLQQRVLERIEGITF